MKIMFDTVNLKASREEVSGEDFLNRIAPRLDPDSVAEHSQNGTVYVTGSIGGLKVSVNDWQVRVKDGSLCKWQLGDNYKSMGRRDVERAIERLSDALGLPMERAIVTRLDVGVTIPMKEPVANYISHLGAMSRATRLLQPHSLYYCRHGKDEILTFYDKNREQRDSRMPVPDLYKESNVLRYEQRYIHRLPSLLNVEQVTGAMLYDESFYMALLDRWLDGYKSIEKINDITLNFQAMKSKRDLNRMGILALVEQWGGEVEMIARIKEAQKSGILTPKQALDLRKGVKDACKVRDGMTMPSEAIAELDKKIVTAIRYYR